MAKKVAEAPRKVEEHSHAAAMMAVFAGYAGAHGTHGEPRQKPDNPLKWEIKSTAKTLKEPVTADLWKRHLTGERPLGVISIREDSMCRWGSIDYDVYDADLLKLVDNVARRKLKLMPCRSKSGGLHLFCFTSEWVPAALMQSSLRDVAAQLGIAGSEIFPKQTQIMAERGDLGSWMVMPYFGGTFDGKLKMQVGIKRSGSEMVVEEFLEAAEECAMTGEELAKMARRRPSQKTSPQKEAEPGVEYPEPDTPFGDGPCCLQTLSANKVQSGKQDNTLLMMGIYYKKRYPEDWKEKLVQAASDFFDPPPRSDAVQGKIRTLEKRDYFYTCRAVPMVDFCNKPLCRTRPFGVGAEGDVPMLNGMRRLPTDPPLWFVELEAGELPVELTTDELLNYPLFQKACVNQRSKIFAPLKQVDWIQIVRDAIDSCDPLPPPDEIEGGERERFREMVEEFLTNRRESENVEGLLNGKPWVDVEGNRVCFRMPDLQKFLNREGMKELNRSAIIARLKVQFEGRADTFNIKGRVTRVWAVPRGKLQVMPKLSTPKQEESPI